MRTNRDGLSEAIRKLTGGCLHPGGLSLTRRALEAAAFAPGARLLDLGCGGGASLGLLSDLGFAAVGLDRCPASCARAAGSVPAAPALPGSPGLAGISRAPGASDLPGAAVLRADMSALPFADAVFDGILCECVLSLTKDKAKVLAACARLLCPGGRLILSDLTLAGPRQFTKRGTAAQRSAAQRSAASATGREAGAAGAAAQSGAAPPLCAGGALSVEEWRTLIEAAGLRPVLLEDQSRALRELAAGLAWQGQSLAALSGLWHNAGMAEEAAASESATPGAASAAAGAAAPSAAAPFADRPTACTAAPRLGYLLLIAEKRGERS